MTVRALPTTRAEMGAEFTIEEQYDDIGRPVYFIVSDNNRVTSRWTRKDAEVALAELSQSIGAGVSEQAAH